MPCLEANCKCELDIDGVKGAQDAKRPGICAACKHGAGYHSPHQMTAQAINAQTQEGIIYFIASVLFRICAQQIDAAV